MSNIFMGMRYFIAILWKLLKAKVTQRWFWFQFSNWRLFSRSSSWSNFIKASVHRQKWTQPWLYHVNNSQSQILPTHPGARHQVSWRSVSLVVNNACDGFAFYCSSPWKKGVCSIWSSSILEDKADWTRRLIEDWRSGGSGGCIFLLHLSSFDLLQFCVCLCCIFVQLLWPKTKQYGADASYKIEGWEGSELGGRCIW